MPITVCEEKQHDFRNAVDSLKGWILKLSKDGNIDKFERDIGLHYLKKISVCSKLDKGLTESEGKQ